MFSLNDIFEEDVKEIRVEDLLNTKIAYKSKAMDIETILNNLKRGDYVLPKYQRKFVWEKADVSNLILSLMKNIPIPPLYLYYDNHDGKYVILDGQQRITSLFMYYKNIFYKSGTQRIRLNFKEIANIVDSIEILTQKEELTDEENNKVTEAYTDMQNKYNIVKSKFDVSSQDITFENFGEEAKRVLRRKDLDVVFVQCEGKNPNKVYTEIFKLLNSAGKELSSQEIRNGIYSDNLLYEKLDKFNEDCTKWRSIYGNSLVAKDFEYLLRFLALDQYTDFVENSIKINYASNYSLSNIIDSYSEMFNCKYYVDEDKAHKQEVENENLKIENKAESEVDKLKKFFDNIEICEEDDIPGGKILILEAVYIAFSKMNLINSNHKINFMNQIAQLDLRKDFGIGSSTSNKGNVEKRLNKAVELVKDWYLK